MHIFVRCLIPVFVVALLSCSLILNAEVFAAEVKPAQQPVFQASKQPDVQAVRPKRPAKIRLHRNAKGEYTWDITGESADEVVRADTRLRKLLKID
jgi:hypothetical protein